MTKIVFVLSCMMSIPFLSINAQATENEMSFIEVSQAMLESLKNDQSTQEYEKIFADATQDELVAELQTDNQKIAFWVNVYNAYIQIVLKKNPELYEDRRSFFKKDLIDIGGCVLSFSNIEHGIIRRSQWALGLGRIMNPFAPKYQRRYRPSEREPRIHFALNCGAKSCPPVAIYDPQNLDYQLDYMSKKYLERTTEYDSSEKKVTTSTLFSWFRGDFGGKKGIKRMLKSYELIPTTDIDVQFGDYDWTLYLDNYVEIPKS